MMNAYILGIESSCDDTSAAVLCNNEMLSNIIAGQDVHRQYGGVVPEYASRAHQINIVPVVDLALRKAKIDKKQLSAIAFTRGPGLLGSLLVGVSFAKALALSLGIPLIEADHLMAHVFSHFVKIPGRDFSPPAFPYLCLLVSGGHTQIVRVDGWQMPELLGNTIDDAAGEAFDKAAKIMGLGYPGGKAIDGHAAGGDAFRFSFPEPKIPGLNFSFSGLKTSFLYFLRDNLRENPDFILENLPHLCASIRESIVSILLRKLILASESTGIRNIALAGGVSANSRLRQAVTLAGKDRGWKVYLPEMQFTTDNAAMVAIAGYSGYLAGKFCELDVVPYSKSGQHGAIS